MDEYLIPMANFKRLYEEYKKYGSLSIYVDFDNTIYDYHKKGYTYGTVISLLQRAHRLGMKIVILTCNPDHTKIHEYCLSKGLQIDGVNTDVIDLGWETRKPFYSLLLDDRAGLISAVEDLSMVINELEMEEFVISEADGEKYN